MTARISFSRRTRALLTARHAVAAIVQTVLARIVVAGLSVGTGIVTSRCLGVQGRGEQSAMILWPTLLSYLLCFGVPIALRYTARRNPGDKAKIYTVSLVAAIIASCLVVAVGYAFIPLWLHQYSKAIVSFSQLRQLPFNC